MKTRSLSRRIIGIVLAAQITGALVLAGVALLHERRNQLRAFDVRLIGHSDSLLGAIQDAEDPEDNVTIDPAELRLPPEDVYAVYGERGRLVGTSPAAPAELIAPASDGFRSRKVVGTGYRIFQRRALRIIDRAENGGIGLKRPVTLLYASPDGRIWHEIAEAAGRSLLTILLVSTLTTLLVLGLLRRALQPLTDLANATGRLAAPSLLFEAPASALAVQELKPLAQGLSAAVSRLKEAFAREQQFVGDAAHELKTAVAVVRSTVQVLMLKPRTLEEHAAGLARVLEDNERVEALIAQMLNSGLQADLRAAPPLDLAECAHGAANKLGSIAQARGITLQVDSAPVPLVPLWPQHASVLIANLLVNAIQHSPAGACVHLSVACGANSTVVLTVTDNGSGIGAEALPHVFERFYREDTSRSRETGGAGLGLAICKSIVEAAGGSIQLHSRPGQGTTAVVTFMVD